MIIAGLFIDHKYFNYLAILFISYILSLYF